MQENSLSSLTKRFKRRLILLIFSVFVFCVVASVLGYLYHYNRMIAVVGNSLREFIVVGDQRIATKIMSLALEHGFVGIQACPIESKSIISGCISVGALGNSFLNHNVLETVYWNPNREDPLASIYGVVSLQVPILFGLCLWALVFLISLPVVFQIRKGLIISYQQSLRERADLDYATLAKQIVHDIRSPLSALKIGIETISPENLNRNIGLLSLALNRIMGLTNDLDRRAKRSVNYQIERFFDIAEVVASLVAEKNLEFSGSHSVLLFVERNHNIQGFVAGNDLEFRRVISNLINNAREAMLSSRDSIVVRLKLENMTASLMIEDFGIGFDDNVLEKILGGTLISTKGGLGLGLSHARAVISAMKGSIKIASKKGQGSMVSMVFKLFPISENG